MAGEDQDKNAPDGSRPMSDEEFNFYRKNGRMPTPQETGAILQQKAAAENKRQGAAPAAEAPAGPKKPFMQKLGEAGERGGWGTGVFGSTEHPEVGLAKQAYEDLKSGEYQDALHHLYGATMETLRPTAGMIGYGGVPAALKSMAGAYGVGKLGEKVGPAVGLKPELGGDIGSFFGGFLPQVRAVYRTWKAGQPKYSGAREETMPPSAPAPETPPQTPAPAAPAPKTPTPATPEPLAGIGSSVAALDAATRRMGLGDSFENLSQENKLRVMREGGVDTGALPPVERRKPGGPGVSPTGLERRGGGAAPPPAAAPNVPQGTPPAGPAAGGAGPEPFTTKKDSMGITWAVTAGLPDISIPSRLTPAEIPAYVAEKQALQRQGLQNLPKTTPTPTPTPTPSGDVPAPTAAPSGKLPTVTPFPKPGTQEPPPPEATLPTTNVPPAPAPTTLGGGTTGTTPPGLEQLIPGWTGGEEERQLPKVKPTETPPK